jgi:hypothetical protein
MTSRPASSAVDMADLARLRDELGVQAHRFEADLKDRWLEAERRWRDIEKELLEATRHSRFELTAATSLAAEALLESYRELRQALQAR